MIRITMGKKITTFFFIALFTAFLVAPTLSLFSDSVDSALFYSLNEEDTTSNENLKVFRVHNLDHMITYESDNCLLFENLLPAYVLLYTPYVSECISPPPELT